MSTASNTNNVPFWAAVMAAEDSAMRVQTRTPTRGLQDRSELDGGRTKGVVASPVEGLPGPSQAICQPRRGNVLAGRYQPSEGSVAPLHLGRAS